MRFRHWPDGLNLAYVGNPTVFGAGLQNRNPPYTVQPNNILALKAQLDGIASCGTSIVNYAWKNAATVGHLTSPSILTGQQDNYTTLFSTATYTASAGQLGGGDDISVTFLPDLSNPPAALACTKINVPQKCTAVVGSNPGHHSTTCNLAASTAGATWTLQLITTGAAPYGSFKITFNSVPGTGAYGIDSSAVLSPSAIIAPNALGTKPTYTMTFPGPSNQNGFVIVLNDMTNPSVPHGNITTAGRDPNTGLNISMNLTWAADGARDGGIHTCGYGVAERSAHVDAIGEAEGVKRARCGFLATSKGLLLGGLPTHAPDCPGCVIANGANGS